jgi:hypothetical protein
MTKESDTPRVDAFVRDMEPVRINPPDFVSKDACFRAAEEYRKLMLAWAQFASELERELNNSIPKEWLH